MQESTQERWTPVCTQMCTRVFTGPGTPARLQQPWAAVMQHNWPRVGRLGGRRGVDQGAEMLNRTEMTALESRTALT